MGSQHAVGGFSSPLHIHALRALIHEGTHMTNLKLPRRQFLQLATGAAALSGVSRVAWAQAYPSHPITMVVPAPPGGATDVIGRIVAGRIAPSLGQSVIIENVTGAGGSIGVGRVARSAPDGHTLGIGQSATHVLNGATYALQYDLLKDFEPVALLSTTPYMLVAKNAVPAKDLKEFIAWLKANPDKASQGTPGVGSMPHVSGVLFQKETGTRFQFVPYRGGAPALQDLVAGNVDMMITDPTTSLSQVRAGRIKAYAIAAKTRLAVAPEIPTVDEAGLPGFYASLWHGLWRPKGTPKNITVKLSTAVMDALADPAVRSRLAEIGQEIFPHDRQTSEALGALQKADIEKWWPIIKAAKIKGE
jgi:tripartite-type tricarboxylate transporter receptor subunit TctC